MCVVVVSGRHLDLLQTAASSSSVSVLQGIDPRIEVSRFVSSSVCRAASKQPSPDRALLLLKILKYFFLQQTSSRLFH